MISSFRNESSDAPSLEILNCYFGANEFSLCIHLIAFKILVCDLLDLMKLVVVHQHGLILSV